MTNDSRKARREAERVAQAAREAAGFAPGAALSGKKDAKSAPANDKADSAGKAGESSPAASPTDAAAKNDAGATTDARAALEVGTKPEATTDANASKAAQGSAPSDKKESASVPGQGTGAAKAGKLVAASKAAKDQPARRSIKRGSKIGVLGSLGVLCLGAAAIAAGSVLPPATGGSFEPAVTSLPAGDSLATCPSTMKLFTGAGTGVDPEFAPASKDAKTGVRAAVISDAAGRIPGTELLKNDLSVEKEIAPRVAPEEAQTSTGASADGTSELKGAVSPVSSFAEALTLHAQPLGGVQSLASAVRSYTATDGDLAGLAVAGCTAPAAETWLTGAVTTPGSTAVLNLVNSSASVAQVRIDLRGADGTISAPNLSAVSVAPGESKSIVLAGYAPNEKVLSAKVSATGGRVNATIQQSTLRGLVPGGIDYLGAAATASTSQIIPGVSLLAPAVASELSKPAANSDAEAQVVLAATSAEGATVNVKAFGPNGETEIPGGSEVVVASNATASLSLAGLPAGNYTMVIEADSPVSAAVKMVRGTKAADPIDLAWAGAAQRLGSEHLMVLPSVGSTQLVLNAPAESATVNVRSLDSAGKLSANTKVALADGKSVVLDGSDFGNGAVALLISATGSPSYGAAVIQEGNFGLGALPVGEAPAGREGVTVLLRD